MLLWQKLIDAIPGVVPSTIKTAMRENEEISLRNKTTVDAIDAVLEADRCAIARKRKK